MKMSAHLPGRGWFQLEQLRHDLRHGVRQLAKNPGTTILAVLSLAVGIGVNSTLFSVMDAAFSRPLPIAEPNRIVRYEPRVTLEEFDALRASVQSLSGLLAATQSLVLLEGTEGFEKVSASAVSGNYFEVLGNAPAAGRFFSERSPELDEPIAVLSYALWQRRFGGDPAIVGRTIRVRGRAVTVVGVAAKGFTGENRLPATDVWYPAASGIQVFRGRPFSLVGRLRQGVTAAQAGAEARTIFARPEWQALALKGRAERVPVVAEGETRGRWLTYLMAPVSGLVLLVACANVASLLLGRYEERRREIAVRIALGANRWRVVRSLLTEGAVLSLMGGGAALALTAWGTKVMPSVLPNAVSFLRPDARVDLRVLLLTLGCSVLATLMFGLIPAWRAARRDVASMLQSDGGHLGRTPSRDVLVVAQVAVAMLFLAVAGLFVGSFWNRQSHDLGFSERNLLLAQVARKGGAIGDFDGFLDDVRRTVAALPGVRAVTLAHSMETGHFGMPVREPGADASQLIPCNSVDPGFFKAVGTPLRRGRDFDVHDRRGGRPVAIVSEAMARRFWPNEDAVGQILSSGDDEPTLWEVVGVAGNIVDTMVPDSAAKPFFYLPLRQQQTRAPLLIVNTSRSPAELAPATREALGRMQMPVETLVVDTIEGRLRVAMLPQWIGAWLGGLLGVLAFLLATSGLYGVVAYAVARRSRELGIRIALGAAPQGAVRLVLRQGVALALVGVALGLLVAVVAGQLLRSFLFGISPTDPLALAGSALIVMAVAALASYLPARRVGRLDPMVVLREE